jgi:hypothetical protein
MLSTSQHTTWVARSSSSFRRDLEVLRHLHMLLEAVVQQALFQEACRLYHMFLNQLEATMVTPIITAVSIVATTLQETPTVNHTLNHKLLISSQRCQCIMVDHLQLEAMVGSDLNNHIKLAPSDLNPTLDHPLSQCRAWFQASR